MDDLSSVLANNIIEFRRQRNLSQMDLAKVSKIPRPTISNLESGSGNPSLQTLSKLSSALQIRIDELLSPKVKRARKFSKTQLKIKKLKDATIEIIDLLPIKDSRFQFDHISLQRETFKIGAPHLKGTFEFFYVLSGEFKVVIEGESHNLKSGELLYFAGDQKHSYLNTSTKTSKAISVVLLT